MGWGRTEGAMNLGVLRDRDLHVLVRPSEARRRIAGEEAVFDLDGRCLEGDLGPRATRLIVEWCQERSEDLLEAWACAVAGKEIPWVAPLR